MWGYIYKEMIGTIKATNDRFLVITLFYDDFDIRVHCSERL